MLRRISGDGLSLLKKRESCVLRVYTDRGGKKTVGWGHLLTPAEIASGKWKDGITQDEADNLLRADLSWVTSAIDKNVKVSLTQGQFDALCSLVYNCGTAPLFGTLGKLLNAGKYDEAGQEFLKWCHVGGKVDADLKDRRKKELDFWLKPDPVEKVIPIADALNRFGDDWLESEKDIPDDVA